MLGDVIASIIEVMVTGIIFYNHIVPEIDKPYIHLTQLVLEFTTNVFVMIYNLGFNIT
jgi:hypothetical protein